MPEIRQRYREAVVAEQFDTARQILELAHSLELSRWELYDMLSVPFPTQIEVWRLASTLLEGELEPWGLRLHAWLRAERLVELGWRLWLKGDRMPVRRRNRPMTEMHLVEWPNWNRGGLSFTAQTHLAHCRGERGATHVDIRNEHLLARSLMCNCKSATGCWCQRRGRALEADKRGLQDLIINAYLNHVRPR